MFLNISIRHIQFKFLSAHWAVVLWLMILYTIDLLWLFHRKNSVALLSYNQKESTLRSINKFFCTGFQNQRGEIFPIIQFSSNYTLLVKYLPSLTLILGRVISVYRYFFVLPLQIAYRSSPCLVSNVLELPPLCPCLEHLE